MYPWTHFLVPWLLGLLLGMPAEYALLAGLLGALVDLDHYVYYVLVHRDWSVRNAWRAAVVTHESGERTFLHHRLGVALVTPLVVLLCGFSIPLGAAVALAYASHLLLDYVHTEGHHVANVAGFRVDLSTQELVLDALLFSSIFV